MIIRCPTPATAPPTTASAAYVSSVPESEGSSPICTVARTDPGPPDPLACITYDFGNDRSLSRTSPAYLPRIAPTPAETTMV